MQDATFAGSVQTQSVCGIGEADTWRLFRKTGLNTSISYQDISESGGSDERISYYAPSLALNRRITRRTTASVGYQLYLKNSDIHVGGKICLPVSAPRQNVSRARTHFRHPRIETQTACPWPAPSLLGAWLAG